MSSLLTLVSEWRLFDAAIKSAAVVLLAAIAAAALSRASAAWRELAWRLSAASLLLLPLLSLALPDWRVDWLPQWTAEPTQLAAARSTSRPQADRAEPLDRAAIVLPPAAAASPTEPLKGPRHLPPAALETASPPQPAMSRAAIPWLAIAWCTGGLLSLVPLAIGMWQLAGLHRRSQVINDRRWLTLLDELRRQLVVRRRVRLRQCETALAPLTWGALRPVVLAPAEAGAWPDGRRRMVLLHELAHIRRWDWLTQLLAHFVCAMYWFNPLVWLAARQMRIERERACDDVVLASGARPSDYARELLALAARLSNSHTTALAAVPMARRRELEVRLRGILDVRRSRAGLTRQAVCLGAAFAAAAMVPLAMLRAAPPESTESEKAVEKPASVVDLRLVERQVEEAGADRAPLAHHNPEAREQWDLRLEEAVRAALTNSKVVQNLGGVLFAAVAPQSDANHVAGRHAKVQDEAAKATRGDKVRFVLARTNDDVALADFESGVRNLVCDVERAYWDLYYNDRNLAAAQAGRDSALQTWRKVYALHVAGGKGGEAEKEAQAREQYFLFRAQVENSLGLLYTAESRLRYMIGLAPTDGRLIRTADEPTTAEVRFDLDEILPEALTRSIDLRRQREAIKRNELKLKKSQDYLSSVRSDAQSFHHEHGLGDASTDGRGEAAHAKEPGEQDNRGSGASENRRVREFQISGFTLTMPIGFRLATAGVRNAELLLAQSQALLEDQELELMHVLTNSVRDLDRNYQVTVTTFNRRAAAAKQVEAVEASYDAGTTTLDMLLDAQRRLADAEIAYHRALVDYNVAILQVHFRKGSLLERSDILLAEGASAGSGVRKK